MRSLNLGRASVQQATNFYYKQIDGKGQSKVLAKQRSGLKTERGQAKSDKVHANPSLKNVKNRISNYLTYVKETHGTLKGNINSQTLTDWLAGKLERGKIQGSSANTYISQLSNLGIAQQNANQVNTIDTQEIRGSLRDLGFDLGKKATDRAFADAKEICKEMQLGSYGISASLQAEAGMRVDDAITSSKWQINRDNTITIHGSKNGLTYTTAPLRQELIDRVIEAKANGYHVSYTTYRIELKEVVQDLKQKWQGTHGMRYSFAQQRVQGLMKDGGSYKEALQRTSLELGHSRIGITEHYLGK